MGAKKRVLVFNRGYLPGYRAGGPIRSLVNMVDRLGDEFQFLVVTRDRDSGDFVPYPNISEGSWQEVGKAGVLYVRPGAMTARRVRQLVNEMNPDVIYLNSFFDAEFTQKVLIARRLGWLGRCPVVLAPRGEFSPGALGIKSAKKRVYLKVSKFIGLYKGLLWQASSEMEKADILTALDAAISDSILVAQDMPPIMVADHDRELARRRGTGEPLRLCFISRIVPKKNLDFALQVLAKVKSPVIFNIYGPKEDSGYWRRCEQIIRRLPAHVLVEYHGSVDPIDVRRTLANNELLFFPTLGENYGHVIHEALSAGLPVLLSDQTPWGEVQEKEVGWQLPLNNESAFVDIIEDVAGWDCEKHFKIRQKAIRFSQGISENSEILDANRKLFLLASGSGKRLSS